MMLRRVRIVKVSNHSSNAQDKCHNCHDDQPVFKVVDDRMNFSSHASRIPSTIVLMMVWTMETEPPSVKRLITLEMTDTLIRSVL